jgi:hypothetical protein
MEKEAVEPRMVPATAAAVVMATVMTVLGLGVQELPQCRRRFRVMKCWRKL